MPVDDASRIIARWRLDWYLARLEIDFNRAPSSGESSRTNTSGGRIATSRLGTHRPPSPPEASFRSNVHRRPTSGPNRALVATERLLRGSPVGRFRASRIQRSPAAAAARSRAVLDLAAGRAALRTLHHRAVTARMSEPRGHVESSIRYRRANRRDQRIRTGVPRATMRSSRRTLALRNRMQPFEIR